MLAGELYLAADEQLISERLRARRLARTYNSTREDEPDKRLELIAQLFGAVGPKVEIEPPFYCDYGSNIYAGNGLYMNFGCVILDCNRVNIGENLLCGPWCKFTPLFTPRTRKLDFRVESSPLPLILAIMFGLAGAVLFVRESLLATIARSVQAVSLSKIFPQTSWRRGILAESSGIYLDVVRSTQSCDRLFGA